MSITLDSSQLQASDLIQAWFSAKSDVRFVLAGLAGTGKTTIINYIIQELDLRPHNIAFCAYTGKAAMVMRQKGCPASTIHSLIYDPVVEKDEDGNETLTFVRKSSLDKNIRLIVVDEASMVAKEMQEDLETYGIPILYAGDHGQLPPVGDSFATLMENPHIRLEKIHRQAEGNPIIKAAMMARLGQRIPTGIMENAQGSFMSICKRFLPPENLLRVDQILCGKNVTRYGLNQQVRGLLDYTDLSPIKGDKVICLKNNNNNGLVNGMQGVFEHVEPCTLSSGRDGFLTVFKDDEGNYYQHKETKRGIWAKVTNGDGEKETKPAIRVQPQIFLGEKPDMNDQTLAPFDFSYAITVHKSQGSQYNSIIIFDEWLGDASVHSKWLYTAITRGVERVVLATAK